MRTITRTLLLIVITLLMIIPHILGFISAIFFFGFMAGWKHMTRVSAWILTA